MTSLRGNFSLGFLFLAVVVGVSIYALVNISKYGHYLGKPKYNRVELASLLSFGNFYDNKEICTRGWYVEGERLRILKVRLDEDKFTRSAWVQTGDLEIITRIPNSDTHAVETEICGLFQSSRSGEFGDPPVWISQITVRSYKTFGDVREVDI